jgi:hypothetical protein
MWAKCGKLKRLPGYGRICMVTTVVTTVNALKVHAKSPFGYHGYLLPPAYEEKEGKRTDSLPQSGRWFLPFTN